MSKSNEPCVVETPCGIAVHVPYSKLCHDSWPTGRTYSKSGRNVAIRHGLLPAAGKHKQMVQPRPNENASFASTIEARPWLRESRKMSKSTQEDPLAVHSFRALLIDRTGKRAYAAPVSINIASLVLETKNTVKDAAR
jgi:hypothetical protein